MLAFESSGRQCFSPVMLIEILVIRDLISLFVRFLMLPAMNDGVLMDHN